jgi:hypothetical protein
MFLAASPFGTAAVSRHVVGLLCCHPLREGLFGQCTRKDSPMQLPGLYGSTDCRSSNAAGLFSERSFSANLEAGKSILAAYIGVTTWAVGIDARHPAYSVRHHKSCFLSLPVHKKNSQNNFATP